jgi:hypothetical protein
MKIESARDKEEGGSRRVGMQIVELREFQDQVFKVIGPEGALNLMRQPVR